MSFKPIEFNQELDTYLPEIKEKLPGVMNAYLEFDHQVFADGKISGKNKELIALAISLSSKCPYCIAYHTKRAVTLGITREEMLEAAAVAIEMGGAPAVTYTTMMLRALDELGKA